MPDREAIDSMDQRIITALRRDGRLPVLEIARDIGVPEATVRKRLQRLLREGLLKVVAVPSIRSLGFTREVTFAITAEPGQALNVAQRLAESDAVQFVAFGIGAFDLILNAVFKTDEDVFQFVTEWLTIDGIAAYQSMDVMVVFKRSDDWIVRRELACG